MIRGQYRGRREEGGWRERRSELGSEGGLGRSNAVIRVLCGGAQSSCILRRSTNDVRFLFLQLPHQLVYVLPDLIIYASLQNELTLWC
jgi:hypothetical protein